MTTSTRLTDIQLVLLASAAARDNGSLLPPSETLGDGPARIRKVVEQLIRRGLAIEAPLPDGVEAWRTEGEQPIGVVITDAGRAAIHVEPEEAVEEAPSLQEQAPPRTTKTTEVLALLGRPEGATIDELTSATNWLPHTTRAALTGLRKKGHAIERSKRGEITCYMLLSVALA